jgi:hypothetical protein
MTDAHRERSVSFFIGTALLIAGVMCLLVGAIAWRIPAPAPTKVTSSVPTVLPSNSIFDAGVTLFANVPDHRNPPGPAAFGCRVSSVGDAPSKALAKPIPELVGSRVVDGAALTGVIDLGHPAKGARLLCDGPAAAASPSLWVLASQDGPSGQPLAIVVAALFLIGLGALVHPRTRSI